MQNVVAITAIKAVIAFITIERVLPVAARQDIIVQTTIEHVAALVADQVVYAKAAEQLIIVLATVQCVASITAEQDIIPGKTAYVVVLTGAEQGVGIRGAFDMMDHGLAPFGNHRMLGAWRRDASVRAAPPALRYPWPIAQSRPGTGAGRHRQMPRPASQ